jgi:glyoxylase-like metal-dependent hydrolase (beta-lactamase superfamily II)
VVEIAGYRVGAVELARVPYFDVALDPGIVHLTAEQIAAIDWATPYWATADHQVLIGQALWVIVSEDRLVVVDPCLAADPFLRSGPEAIGHQEAALAALRDAGFPPERVDVVVLSHLDGIGMTAVVTPDGGWAPAFPNARVVMTAAELEWLAGGSENAAMTGGLAALDALVDQGVVDGVEDGHSITGEVRLELTGAHTAGHANVWVESEGENAMFLGHLALSPLNIATRDCAATNDFVAREAKALDRLVSEAAAHDTLIVGPLWPFPGAVYATGDPVVTAAD